MSQTRNIIVCSFAALLLSFLFGIAPLQTENDLQESEQPPTTCSVPVIAPSLNLSSITTDHRSKGEVKVTVAIHLQHPGIVGLNDQVEYNVTLRPSDDLAAITSTVASGQVTVRTQRVVSASFVIPKRDAVAGKSWELEVRADAGPDVGRNSGLDRAYLAFVGRTNNNPVAILKAPAVYWHEKTQQLKHRNFTLPKIEGDSISDFEPELLSAGADSSLTPGPIDPLKPRRRVPVSIKVVYEDPNGVKRGLMNARVELLTDPMLQQSSWSYTLNSAGRANDIIVATNDDLPQAAKLYLVDPLFSMKQGATETNTALWQYDLNFAMVAGKITITGDLVASIGPDIGHVWSEFHRIRSGGENVVGLSGVPHIDIWFPCNGADCTPVCNPVSGSCTPPNSYYRPGGNRIALNTVHTRVPEVLSHEYGHHVMHSLMPGGIPNDARTGDHYLCSNNANDAMAWVEGYPTAFGLKVTGQRTFYGLDFEALSCPANRDMRTSEGRVAAGMLDLMDVGTVAECSGGDDNLGRPGYCDRTTGNLFNPVTVLRQSITVASFNSVLKWWETLSTTLKGQVGIADGWEAMRYNYYPLPPCRRRFRNICLDIILPWTPPAWVLGPSQPRVRTRPSPVSSFRSDL